MPDIWPKLLKEICDAVYPDLRGPLRSGLAQGAFLAGIIQIRDSRPKPITNDFGEIKRRSA